MAIEQRLDHRVEATEMVMQDTGADTRGGVDRTHRDAVDAVTRDQRLGCEQDALARVAPRGGLGRHAVALRAINPPRRASAGA